MSAQGAVLRPMPPAGINRPIPISVPGRRYGNVTLPQMEAPLNRYNYGDNWINGIHMKKGALRAMAPSAFTKRGTLKKSWLKKASKKPGVLGRRARLAETLGSFNRRKFSARRRKRTRSRKRRTRRKSCKKGSRRHPKTKRCRKIRSKRRKHTRKRTRSRKAKKSKRRSRGIKAKGKNSKCKTYLAAKMKENMHKWKHGIPMKNGKLITSQRQAMAMSYSQVKKSHPACKRYF